MAVGGSTKVRKVFYFCVIFIIFSFFGQFCSKSSYDKKEGRIDFKSISIIKKTGKEFLERGKLEKIIKLETIDNSLITEIDKIMVDSKTGDIYVLNQFPGEKLVRFDKEGKFINCYGRRGEGPGEYMNIRSFTIDADKNVILVSTRKLLKFEKNGRFIKEKRVNFLTGDINAFLDKIYIFVGRYKYTPEVKYSILILDSDFNEIGGLSIYDTRLGKYSFGGKIKIANSSRNVCFIENYNLLLQIYNPGQDKLTFLEFPNNNKKLNSIWGKVNFVEEDRTEIKAKLHFFTSIYAFKDNLFLNEMCKEKGILNNWLINLEKRKAIIFNFTWAEFVSRKLIVMGIYGSYDRGLIGVIADSDVFNAFKNDLGKNYPFFNEIDYSLEDNPILVFMEFDDKIWE